MNNIDNKMNDALNSLQSANDLGYIGEAVSQLEHSLQCAYFAEQSGHHQDVILACLFHDIGHFASPTLQYHMADLGVMNHEWVGAKLAYDFGFSAKVALLIGYHVDAKRYLAGKKAGYFNRLSEASKNTLKFQGGMMSAQERVVFEYHPYFKDILQVRINDEKAKETNLKVPGLDYYQNLIQEHLGQHSNRNHDIKLPDYVDALWVNRFKTFLESHQH